MDREMVRASCPTRTARECKSPSEGAIRTSASFPPFAGEETEEEHDAQGRVSLRFRQPERLFWRTRSIPAIEQRTGATFTYVPILLGGVFKLTNNQSPIAQFKDIKNKLPYQRLEIERFVKKHGLTQFKMNPHFPVNTIQIMRGAVAAEMEAFAKRYIERSSPHVGGAQEDGRARGHPRRARFLRPRRRAHPGTHPGPGGEGHAA